MENPITNYTFDWVLHNFTYKENDFSQFEKKPLKIMLLRTHSLYLKKFRYIADHLDNSYNQTYISIIKSLLYLLFIYLYANLLKCIIYLSNGFLIFRAPTHPCTQTLSPLATRRQRENKDEPVATKKLLS